MNSSGQGSILNYGWWPLVFGPHNIKLKTRRKSHATKNKKDTFLYHIRHMVRAKFSIECGQLERTQKPLFSNVPYMDFNKQAINGSEHSAC
jgi:hypothetical protein